MEDFDALIVGGGVGGLALGCKLANSRLKICVLEARSEVKQSKRGLTLQPNGLEALEKLGPLDEVMRIGVKTSRVVWYEIGGGLLATLDYSLLNHPQNYLLTVVPSDLELVLRNEFVKSGGTIYDSTFFQELHRDQPRHVVVKAQRKGSPVEFSARMLIGADGENSRVRKAIGVPTRVREYPDHFLFMMARPVKSFQEEARQYLARGKMIGCFPSRDSTYIFYYLPRGRLDKLKERELPSFKDELVIIEPELSGALDNLHSWDDLAYAVPMRVDLNSWVGDRVALLGDAVHALDPSLAQGANMTLQDAVILADTIEGCFQSGDFSTDALKPYENARRKQVEFLQRQAERTAQVTTTESRFSAWLGKRLLRRVGRNEKLMLLALKMSSGLVDHLSISEQIRFLL